MIGFDEIRKIAQVTPSRILLLVMDGIGGLPHPDTGKTELETANTPNLDRLASEGICGMAYTVSPGITPGSAPGHMSLFGYEPTMYQFGRGIVEALGLDIEVGPGDVVVRGNFCTVDDDGVITDRRAGRIPTEVCKEQCAILNKGVAVSGTQVQFFAGKDHRFVMRLRGDGLSHHVGDTDPQHEGMHPLAPEALDPSATRTAEIAADIVAQARTLLKDRHPANMFLLRGFSEHPDYPSINDIYGLTPACIAPYPMYRGVSRVVGMDILPAGETLEDEVAALKKNYDKYDYFFMHYKKTDAKGEDGDFDAKVQAIEDYDRVLPSILELNPDVVIVTGDHSTPAGLVGHSWHTVPVILSAKYCRRDEVTAYGESACLKGGLGVFAAVELMPLAMANALKLNKFGA